MPVSLSHVSHAYRRGEPDEIRALENISLSIGDGEFTLILGRNGSGKSTLLQSMAGLLKPGQGSVTIDGSKPAVSRDSVAYAIQFPERALFEQTLYDDIAFGLHNRGVKEPEVKSQVLTAMDAVGLGRELLWTSPRELSHGQKRLAALAGIIAGKPKYLFLDEPTAGLDAAGRERVLKVLTDLISSGTTIVVASHDLAHFLDQTWRIIILDKGQIAGDLNPENLISMESLESMGLALPYSLKVARMLAKKGIVVKDLSPDTLADGIGRMRENENPC